jgi:glycosyltransferase 2 family protein
MTDQIANASISRPPQNPYSSFLLAISFGLFGWVLWRAGFSELFKYLRAADYGLIILSVLIILLGLLLRAIRWRILLLPLGSPSIPVSFGSMMLGYLGNNLLPLRAGEVVRAYTLGLKTSISKFAIFATIIVERVVDGFVMVFILLLLFHVFVVPDWLRLSATSAGVVLSATSVALIIARGKSNRLLDIFRTLLSRLPRRWRPKAKLLVDEFLLGLTSFRSSNDTIAFLLLTLVIWGSEALVYSLLMRAFGISLPILAVALIIAASTVSTIIPASPGYNRYV